MRYCIVLLTMVPTLFGQSADTALTQTLITEIRALRQEIQATTVTAQRVQIALFRLQSQTALMAGAQQRLDAARAKVLEIQSNRRHVTEQVQRLESAARTTQVPAEKQGLEQNLEGMKAEGEAMAAEEGQRRSAEADAESQFRAEQAKLSDLQSLLDRLDKALDEIARPRQ